MPRLAVLDESKQPGAHPILSVGGFIAELADVPTVERTWSVAKESVGLDPEQEIKFSGDWSISDPRHELLCAMSGMPIQALVVLLEDFRPLRMKAHKETRKDGYVHRQAFEYALQRIGRQYVDGSEGPHLVAFDRRDDFAEFEKTYMNALRHGWKFSSSTIPPLAHGGFAASLLECGHGPLHEIADFVVAGLTLWASVRCCEAKGKTVKAQVSAAANLCAPIVRLLPRRPGGGTRVGWSVVVHAQALTGKELLRERVEAWLDALETSEASA